MLGTATHKLPADRVLYLSRWIGFAWGSAERTVSFPLGNAATVSSSLWYLLLLWRVRETQTKLSFPVMQTGRSTARCGVRCPTCRSYPNMQKFIHVTEFGMDRNWISFDLDCGKDQIRSMIIESSVNRQESNLQKLQENMRQFDRFLQKTSGRFSTEKCRAGFYFNR